MDSKDLEHIWGFEGCGSMWTFFSDQESALKHAGTNQVFKFGLEDAHALDNKRRKELGSVAITFKLFLECIDHTASCSPFEYDCNDE
ncbi:MAG: hypothetical protein KAR33_12250 [Candidatus Thorarchaeota archaeon]|nr:hypothetical protein [Candidatus Thorarchaeota archaeon]